MSAIETQPCGTLNLLEDSVVMDRFSDSLRRFGDEVKRKVDALPKRVQFAEMFNPAFMRKHTRVPTFEALIEAGDFNVETTEDFKAIPDDAWEQNIRTQTSFQSWEEMQRIAGEEWAASKLRF